MIVNLLLFLFIYMMNYAILWYFYANIMIFRSIFYSMKFSLFEVSGIILIRSLNRQVFRENWKLDARISIHFSTGIYNFQPLNVRHYLTFELWRTTFKIWRLKFNPRPLSLGKQRLASDVAINFHVLVFSLHLNKNTIKRTFIME